MSSNIEVAIIPPEDQEPQAKKMKSCHNLETTGVTTVQMKKFSYKWVIRNFRGIVKEPGQSMLSSYFSSDSRKEDVWCLELYPNGYSRKDEGFLSIFLTLVSSKPTKEEVTFHISILDSEYTSKVKNTRSQTFKCINGRTETWGWSSFLKRIELFSRNTELLPNGTLTIRCDVEKVDDIVTTTDDTPVLSPIQIPDSTLIDELGAAVENEEFCDVLLKIGDTQFRAIRGILAARSPVFARMFSHDNMKENQTNQVDIPDVSEDVFRELLYFIYTDTAPNLNEMPEELLAAADKYQLKRLKVMCEKALFEKISIDNAVEIFVLSELYNAEKLKDETVKFMKGRENEALLTDGYKSLQVTNNHQALKLCEMLLIGEPMLAPKNSTTK